MSKPRVLLVEDDASLRRFVAMALEDIDIELVQCVAVAPALALLREGSFCLVLTDLMMPGESGFDLLAHMQRVPALRGSAKVVVLSAGLTSAVREQLADAGVWRMLSKPVSVGALVGCVSDAIADAQQEAAPVAPDRAGRGQRGDRAHALHEYFEGNRELFDAYSGACMEQFPQDVRQGDAAIAQADLQAIRRVAHSLKSVLLTLGYPHLSAQARALEETSHDGLQEPAQAQWSALRAALLQVLQTAGN